jgi:hypothetical protein
VAGTQYMFEVLMTHRNGWMNTTKKNVQTLRGWKSVSECGVFVGVISFFLPFHISISYFVKTQ